MTWLPLPADWIKSSWDVFLLFVIPVGGGIPAGVVLGKNHQLSWLLMTVLYFVSDIVLACVFEPLMLLIRRAPFFKRFNEAMKKHYDKTVLKYAKNPSPLKLILVSFGIDPMTGRTAAAAAGHGFISGWTIAIIGDMFFFWLIMGSTLWLNNVLGDGTWTVVIITVAMLAIPPLVKRLRGSPKSA